MIIIQFGCWWNTFQISFRIIFLLLVNILKFVSFVLENEYGRFRLLRHTESLKYCLFQKLSKNFSSHRNQCKMQIMYDNAHDS